MGDMTVLKKDGYEEIVGVHDAIKKGQLNITALWGAAAQADTTQCALILFQADFLPPEWDNVQVVDILDIILICVPDAVVWRRYLLWIKKKA